MRRSDLIVRIGGEGGEGVISSGEILTKAMARAGWNVFTFRTYPAEIRGGVAMFQLRVASQPIYSQGGKADLFIAFNGEALEQYLPELRPGGALLFDPEQAHAPEEGAYHVLPVPLNRLAREAGSVLTKNIVAVGALSKAFDVDPEIFRQLIRDQWLRKGERVVEMNYRALEVGRQAVVEAGGAEGVALEAVPPNGEELMIISGNQAVGLGAIVAGCRFCAGYPITPATPLFEFLIAELPKFGGGTFQAEDEMAALGACLGASFSGIKAMTCTSGPGISLMSELINHASMLELPVVVVDVQRAGPSTGMPTKTEQGDLKFAIYGTTGESPRIVLAPTSVEDCIYQTVRAFNLSERYQMPAIILSDQAMAYRTQNVKLPDLSMIDVDERILAGDGELSDYRRFRLTETGVSPMTVPGMEGGAYLATGLEHDETGAPKYTPEAHKTMTAKRFRKLATLADELASDPQPYYGSDKARIGVIGWGSTEGAIREARYRAEEAGIPIKHLHPRVVSPLPEKRIAEFLRGLETIIIPEENFTGQFAHFVKAKFGIRPIEVHKAEGIPLTPEEILDAIEEHA
jgi:2-oxoglutarate ferredoxin oxidoreductase subunit alpha